MKVNQDESVIYNFILDGIIKSQIYDGIMMIGISGSLGRGEKNFSDENLNDVDIFVIAASENNLLKKKELENNLNNFFCTNFTDITYINVQDYFKIISSNEISQFWYDTLNGSIILYEDNLKGKKIHNKNEYSIKKNSALTVFFTRLWCLIGPYKIVNGKIEARDYDLAIYQLKKAMSAVVDSILIYESLYSSVLKSEKIKEFYKSKFYLSNKNICDLAFEFYYKDNIDVKGFHEIMINLYNECKKYIFLKNNVYLNILRIDIKYPIKRIVFPRKAKIVKQYIERYGIFQELFKTYNGEISKIKSDYLNQRLEKVYKEVLRGDENE